MSGQSLLQAVQVAHWLLTDWRSRPFKSDRGVGRSGLQPTSRTIDRMRTTRLMDRPPQQEWTALGQVVGRAPAWS